MEKGKLKPFNQQEEKAIRNREKSTYYIPRGRKGRKLGLRPRAPN